MEPFIPREDCSIYLAQNGDCLQSLSNCLYNDNTYNFNSSNNNQSQAMMVKQEPMSYPPYPYENIQNPNYQPHTRPHHLPLTNDYHNTHNTHNTHNNHTMRHPMNYHSPPYSTPCSWNYGSCRSADMEAYKPALMSSISTNQMMPQHEQTNLQVNFNN